MAIELLGFPTTLGQTRTAPRYATESVRRAGLVPMLKARGQTVCDLGDLIPPLASQDHTATIRLQQVIEAARWQADTLCRRHQGDNLMLTIGGDHSTSLGTIWALQRMHHSFDVVWVDAHGDFNTLVTSPTGNPHGMVLSMAAGLMDPLLPTLIPSSALHLWGIRDLDTGERDLLRRHKAEILTPEETRRNLNAAIDRLKPDIFLSFDLDSVDPTEAPGTGTPVPGGFTRQEALDLVAQLATRRRLIAVDVVELHPDLDQDDRTLQLALDVALTAVTGQVPVRSPNRKS